MFILINATLFLFNLIPLPPLDGFAVLNGLVGDRISSLLQPLQTYGPMILMAIFLVPLVLPQLSIGGFLSLGAVKVSDLLLGL
jgi:Zn-dependent protease